ncbi:XylR family transcriptional regulator [Luteolibacter sp. LG18]|nr:XylR family transcriptional regulator [Luteolibacter sp. LG18]
MVGVRFPVWCAFGHPVLEGVVDQMRESGQWKLVTENSFFGEMRARRIDGDWKGDGLILFRATDEELANYRRRGTAVVLTSTEGPDHGYPRVVTDNAAIGRLAADHLIDCAFSNFAFFGRGEALHRDPQHAPGMRVYSRERLGGFLSRLADFHLEPIVHYLKGRPLWKSGTWRAVQREAMEFLAGLPKPCGLFVVDDSLAAVTLQAAEALGLRVPDDVAVIGFGDDPAQCFTTSPTLTSIRYPGREVGRLAADLLARQMAGEVLAETRHVVPVHDLVARDSTDTLAIPDPDIREIVRRIRLLAPHDSLRVSELCEQSSLSPTTIKVRFAALLGRSPKQEIKRVRLQHLSHLLRSTELPLADIVREMKFESLNELSRFFHRETGLRPSALRRSM